MTGGIKILARIITAAVGIPIVLGALYIGGPVFLILLALVTFGAVFEFIRLLNLSLGFAVIASGTIVFSYFCNLHWAIIPWEAMLFLYLIISASLLFVFLYGKLSFLQSAGTIFGGIYITVLASTLYLLRDLENGFFLTLAVLLITWGTDSGAFFVGKYAGKAKLAPAISPNKSWAGAWAGLVTGVIIAVFVGILMNENLLLFALWGLVASVFDQVGDLCESAFKRMAGVKDSGTILPGHGGFLDRIDSLLFTSTLSYIFFGMVL